MANTLWEYYTGKGQKLPTVQERAPAFEQAGLGKATEYKGTAQQNVSYLDYLQKPATPTAPETPAVPPANAETPLVPQPTEAKAPSSIFEMYGMKGEQPKDIFGMYGVEKPEYKEPNTSQYDKTIQQNKPTFDPDAIKRNLEQELASITARYGVEREQVGRETESERMSQISGLYDVGVVNPMSSGLASIGTASKAVEDRRMANVSAREQAEKVASANRAYGRSTAEQEKALEFAQGERTRIDEEATAEYTRDRQAMLDSMDIINGVVDAWKSGRAIDRQDKNDAQDGLKDLIEKGGYSIFDGMTPEDITDLESAGGYPAGTINKWTSKLKQAEMEAQNSKKNEFEMRTIDGSLYLIYPNQLDENGLPKKELFIKKSKSASGSTKTTKMTDEFKKWYYDQFKDLASETNPDAVAEWERWQASGKSAKTDTSDNQWITVGKDKVLVDKSGNELKRIKASASSTGDEEMSDAEFLEAMGIKI